jgi:hypothetical protein
VIVLDTHALVWMDRNDSMLGPQTRALIENTWRSDVVAVSAISFWETFMLADRGRHLGHGSVLLLRWSSLPDGSQSRNKPVLPAGANPRQGTVPDRLQ